MGDQEERVHDADEWHVEASFVIQDVKGFVKDIVISNELKPNDTTIYINLTTRENDTYSIELTIAGYRIVGNKYDDASCPSENFYETPYALLDNISPLYRESFCQALTNKLLALTDMTEEPEQTMETSE